jgi:hypothetical protein
VKRLSLDHVLKTLRYSLPSVLHIPSWPDMPTAMRSNTVVSPYIPQKEIHSLTLETGLNGLQGVCPSASCCLGLHVDKNRLSTTGDTTSELSISESLLMIRF